MKMVEEALLILNDPDVPPYEPVICVVAPFGKLEATVKLPMRMGSGVSAAERTPRPVDRPDAGQLIVGAAADARQRAVGEGGEARPARGRRGVGRGGGEGRGAECNRQGARTRIEQVETTGC